jgi:hypothetical protein
MGVKAAKKAREGDWSMAVAIATAEHATLAFPAWTIARDGVWAWARSAPAEHCAALAQAKLMVPSSFGRCAPSHWGEAGSLAISDAELRGLMAARLALAARGVGFSESQSGSGGAAKFDRADAKRRLNEPGRWEAQAFAELFGPKISDEDALANVKRVASAMPESAHSVSASMRARAAGNHRQKVESFSSLAGGMAQNERGMAWSLGAALAEAGRGAPLGVLWASARANRATPSTDDEEPAQRLLNEHADAAWAAAWRALPDGAQRQACLREAMGRHASRFLTNPFGSRVAAKTVQSAWFLAKAAWGETEALRAWPDDVDAGGFSQIVRARREADAIEEAASAVKKASVDSLANPAPMATGESGFAAGSANEARGGVRGSRRL